MQNVFHIGFPKAGSTYLQHNVFPNVPGYNYVGLQHLRSQENPDRANHLMLLERFYTELLKSDSLDFNAKNLKATLADITENSGQLPFLFSHEAAISVFFSHPDATVKADRILKVLGKSTKIMIVIREQKMLLKSQYRDHPFDPYDIHAGRYVSFENWCNRLEQQRYNSFGTLLFFDRLYEVYEQRFGADNLLIVPMELMNASPEIYAQRLAKFFDIDKSYILNSLGRRPKNEGHSALRNSLRRFEKNYPLTHAFLRQVVPQWGAALIKRTSEKGPPQNIKIPDALADNIDRSYATSNGNLAQKISLDLKALGYSC